MKKSFSNLVENGTLIKSQRAEDELKIVFCNAVKFGDRLEYDIIERSFLPGDFEYNRILIWSMGCCRDQNYLQNYFNLLLNKTFERYFPDIIQSAAENKIGKLILFEILFNRFEEITTHIGLHRLFPLFESISTEFELRIVRK